MQYSSELLSLLAFAIGPQTNGGFVCFIQAFITNYFPLAAVLWTVCIVYQLYIIIVFSSKVENERYLHYLSWGTPLLVSVFPLTSAKYG